MGHNPKSVDTKQQEFQESKLIHIMNQTSTQPVDKLVKTVTVKDGVDLEIYGDKDLGFEVCYQKRSISAIGKLRLPTRFVNIDHADLAVKLFQQWLTKNDLARASLRSPREVISLTNYPVNNKIVRALNWGYRIGGRERLMHLLHIATTTSKQYNSIWVNSGAEYNLIDQILSDIPGQRKKPHVVIYQAEEDWFHNCSYVGVRNKIKNHPNWSDQSYIVTHSRKDKKDSLEMGINAVCRPALTDLITYRPYDCNLINFDNIAHHTGVCWDRQEPDRVRVWSLLNSYQQNISVAKLGSSWAKDQVINNCPAPVVNSDVNAPWQLIDSDLWWAKHIAFGTVLETQWRAAVTHGYAPTTSEKIYRNMHLLRPAVICGGQNTRQYLLDLGFDTWDWFVDWSFDSEPDDELRFQGYLNEIERLLNTPLLQLKELIYQNQDKLLHNRDRLFWLINNYNIIDI